ncbi:hypothetical protein HPB51_005736 [Rhipicephalus microplus]|uniref:Uncharacterized protein n=1 Tax=Rhipicephalus microplus TaxID=6941 RepID=A0A9J6DZH4_RHIMP|nr:hypothetical protein HPB51_005736 [Rhipicephalus microplus]
MGAEAICYSYKPTVQVCKICRSTGHRSDVCLAPNANVCSKCGTRDPTQEHECALNCAICGEEHATGDKSCKKKLKNVAPRKSRVETPRRQTECTYAEKDFPQFEQHQQKPPRWFSSDREEATLQTRQASRSSSRSRSRSRSSSKTPQQRNISKPAEAPGKPNLKKTSSRSLETSSAHARKEEAVAATTGLSTQDVQNKKPTKVSWASPVPPKFPATDSLQYRKILEENKRLTQEIKQLRNQMAAEREEYKMAISSMEIKLENAIKKIQNPGSIGNPTVVAHMKDNAETSAETIDEDSFANQSESSELVKLVQMQVQANRESIAALHKLLGDFMAEMKTFVVEELKIQRQYVNDAVGGL